MWQGPKRHLKTFVASDVLQIARQIFEIVSLGHKGSRGGSNSVAIKFLDRRLRLRRWQRWGRLAFADARENGNHGDSCQNDVDGVADVLMRVLQSLQRNRRHTGLVGEHFGNGETHRRELLGGCHPPSKACDSCVYMCIYMYMCMCTCERYFNLRLSNLYMYIHMQCWQAMFDTADANAYCNHQSAPPPSALLPTCLGICIYMNL